jgi:hypothetical protein
MYTAPQVLERQVSQLQALLDKGPSMEGLLPATGGLEAVPDPMAMLRQRQQVCAYTVTQCFLCCAETTA